jgi:L-aspartate oxidase
MWDDVGIVRDGSGLAQAKAALAKWQSLVQAPVDRPSQEVADLLTCSRLVTEAALIREESRGAHYRTDFPEPREEWRRHLVFRTAR